MDGHRSSLRRSRIPACNATTSNESRGGGGSGGRDGGVFVSPRLFRPDEFYCRDDPGDSDDFAVARTKAPLHNLARRRFRRSHPTLALLATAARLAALIASLAAFASTAVQFSRLAALDSETMRHGGCALEFRVDLTRATVSPRRGRRGRIGPPISAARSCREGSQHSHPTLRPLRRPWSTLPSRLYEVSFQRVTLSSEATRALPLLSGAVWTIRRSERQRRSKEESRVKRATRDKRSNETNEVVENTQRRKRRWRTSPLTTVGRQKRDNGTRREEEEKEEEEEVNQDRDGEDKVDYNDDRHLDKVDSMRRECKKTLKGSFAWFSRRFKTVRPTSFG